MNVIILTTGISGSSVITGFLAKSGLWVGDKTIFKDNITGKYETYENKKLVKLNDELVEAAGVDFTDRTYYDANARDLFNNISSQLDTTRYKRFLAECNSHSPWIWKDPKLFLTIGFWKNFLNLADTRVVVVHRNVYELWKSQAIKRIIYSYSYLKSSEEKSRHELLNYLERNNFSFVSLEYDQFLKDPVTAINRLNKFIGTNLNKPDWDEIYRPTSKFSRYKRAFTAYLIYLKNYNSRIK